MNRTLKDVWEGFAPGTLWHVVRTRLETGKTFEQIRKVERLSTRKVYWHGFPLFQGCKLEGSSRKMKACELRFDGDRTIWRFTPRATVIPGDTEVVFSPAKIEDINKLANDATLDGKHIPSFILELWGKDDAQDG